MIYTRFKMHSFVHYIDQTFESIDLNEKKIETILDRFFKFHFASSANTIVHALDTCTVCVDRERNMTECRPVKRRRHKH